MINGAVAGLVGIYLLMVVWGGKEKDLFDLIKQETGFLKWAGAVITLSIIYNALPKREGEILRNIVMVGFLALGVGYGDKILSQVEEVFKEK